MTEPWHKNAVYYGVDIKTFVDSDGDGIGDINGLVGKLDHLTDLGVTCLWLLPFYPSPLGDNGYDVVDYCAIDPRLGTLDDFERLVREAQSRGMRIITDLIVNHTSDQHPWFQEARRDRSSRFRNYYIWSDEPVELPDVSPIFPGAESSIWEYDDVAGQYFLHRFYRFEPDLNTLNPAVCQEILEIMDFWLRCGIAGFRVDAAPYLVQPKGGQTPDGDRFRLFYAMRETLARYLSDGLLLGEADVEPRQLGEMFGDGQRLNAIFNFALTNETFLALARQNAEPLARLCQTLPTVPPGGQWANFLRNLDELDLERLSEPEREEVYAAFAPDESMRIYNRGIRRRLAPMLDGDQRRIEAAFSLLCSLPGAPVIAYGDEIGMGDDLCLEQRNSVRTPMQWDDTTNAGFSSSDPARLFQPVIRRGPFRHELVNVADQKRDADSLFSRVKTILAARKAALEIGLGSYEMMTRDQGRVLLTRYDRNGQAVVTVNNLSTEPISTRLDICGNVGPVTTLLADRASLPTDADGQVHLGPYGYRWLRVGGA